jgi:hypothetical protein
MHYCIYTKDLTPGVITALRRLTATDYQLHANRTRFHLDQDDSEHLQFYIKYSDCIHCIDHESDHVLGR